MKVESESDADYVDLRRNSYKLLLRVQLTTDAQTTNQTTKFLVGFGRRHSICCPPTQAKGQQVDPQSALHYSMYHHLANNTSYS